MAGIERKLRLSKFEEIRAKAYENSGRHKERPKLFHDRHICREEVFSGQKVLVYDSKLHLFPGKLRSRFTGPFIISHVFPHGALEMQDPIRGTHFKVKGQRLKPFVELPTEEREVECLMLYEQEYRG